MMDRGRIDTIENHLIAFRCLGANWDEPLEFLPCGVECSVVRMRRSYTGKPSHDAQLVAETSGYCVAG